MKSLQYLLFYIQALSPSAGKPSLLLAAIESLQKGISWRYTRPFLTLEARYFQATTLGLPVEISKYYHSLSAVTVNGEELNAITFYQQFGFWRNWKLFLFFCFVFQLKPLLIHH